VRETMRGRGGRKKQTGISNDEEQERRNQGERKETDGRAERDERAGKKDGHEAVCERRFYGER